MKELKYDDRGNLTVEQSGPPMPHDEWRAEQDRLAKEEADASEARTSKRSAKPAATEAHGGRAK